MARKNRCVAESWTYVTKGDREVPKAEQTVFTLRPMTFAERDQTRDTLSAFQSTRAQARIIARDGIVGVQNFPVGDAKPWPSKRDEKEAYLAMLDDDDVLEIGNEIFAMSTLGADEKPLKNVSTPEPTLVSGVSSEVQSSTTAPSATSDPS